MVVKLGTLGGEKDYKTLSWKDFKKSEYFPQFKEMVKRAITDTGEWRVPVERILKGGKYPSVAIIWEAVNNDKEIIRVKLSIQKEQFKEVLKALGITRLNECGSGLDFVLFKDEDKITYGIDKTSLGKEFCYVDRGSYYELTTAQKEKEADEFDF